MAIKEALLALFRNGRKTCGSNAGDNLDSGETMGELNFGAYEQSREQLRKQYPNEFVAFIDGQLVGHAPNRQTLIDKIGRKWRRTDILVTKPSADDVIKLRRPRKVL